MKQKDIALFVVVGIVTAVFSVIASNYLITPAQNKKQEAEIVEPISAEFSVPTSDNKYFNKNAINPTKLIQIGDNPGNGTPFSNGAQ